MALAGICLAQAVHTLYNLQHKHSNRFFFFLSHFYGSLPEANPLISYSLSRKTVNTRENFWNVYCFATNQMRDETAKDRQTAALISHDSTGSNELSFSSTRKLQFYRFEILKFFFLRFRLW